MEIIYQKGIFISTCFRDHKQWALPHRSIYIRYNFKLPYCCSINKDTGLVFHREELPVQKNIKCTQTSNHSRQWGIPGNTSNYWEIPGQYWEIQILYIKFREIWCQILISIYIIYYNIFRKFRCIILYYNNHLVLL